MVREFSISPDMHTAFLTQQYPAADSLTAAVLFLNFPVTFLADVFLALTNIEALESSQIALLQLLP